MPSPIGHTLTGVCLFVFVRNQVSTKQVQKLLLLLVAVSNLPDIDILPGLLVGDPRAFHRQATHSFTIAILLGIFSNIIATKLAQKEARKWGGWISILYGSHILLDLFVVDRRPPFGVQALWPFSQDYFISPFSIFQGFHYFDPNADILETLLSQHNFKVFLQEFIFISPFIIICYFYQKFKKL